MKRILSIVILIGITLNCLSRLGVMSYVYVHRHDIAYAMGIHAEKMISMCNGDYFRNSHLTVQQEDYRQVPAGLTQEQEIILGCPPSVLHTPLVSFEAISQNGIGYCWREYHPPYSEIFHPPLA